MTKFARFDRLPPYVFANVNEIKSYLDYGIFQPIGIRKVM